jgi:glyoxylase-like metal-dependent hydrolase (beta-lactamase superfamily II)
VNVYLARHPHGLAVVDTGARGSEGVILDAVREVGGDLHQIVLTHFHKDHAGSAAALRAATGATVVAGAIDAPVIAGAAAEPEAVITDEERPFYERVSPTIPPAPAVTVDRVLREGDDLGWAEPALVIDAPGHTPGGIAIHLPRSRVLISGDNIATLNGTPILGPFNVDRAGAIGSFRRLARLDIETLCCGHGDPVPADAATALRRAASRLS